MGVDIANEKLFEFLEGGNALGIVRCHETDKRLVGRAKSQRANHGIELEHVIVGGFAVTGDVPVVHDGARLAHRKSHAVSLDVSSGGLDRMRFGIIDDPSGAGQAVTRRMNGASGILRRKVIDKKLNSSPRLITVGGREKIIRTE